MLPLNYLYPENSIVTELVDTFSRFKDTYQFQVIVSVMSNNTSETILGNTGLNKILPSQVTVV